MDQQDMGKSGEKKKMFSKNVTRVSNSGRNIKTPRNFFQLLKTKDHQKEQKITPRLRKSWKTLRSMHKQLIMEKQH